MSATVRLAAVLTVLVAAGLGHSGASSAVDPAAGDAPWALLVEARDQLRERSPLVAGFSQTFVPSGFSVGDSESGALYLDLPRCLRFEYLEPFPKNFLLCGDWVYAWNPGEPSGRRYLTAEGEGEGLDLLRLDVDALRKRYRARIGARAAGDDDGDGDGNSKFLALSPIGSVDEIRSATLELGPLRSVLRSLSYEDEGGNRTRFEITDYRPLDERTAFRPPELEWLQD